MIFGFSVTGDTLGSKGPLGRGVEVAGVALGLLVWSSDLRVLGVNSGKAFSSPG